MLHAAFGGARAAGFTAASGPGSPAGPAGSINWPGAVAAARLELAMPLPFDPQHAAGPAVEAEWADERR